MGRALGARAGLAYNLELTYGTPPASGFKAMPFISGMLRDDQPLIESEILGFGNDPAAPIRDVITVDGTIRVPVDTSAFGHWLRLLLGAPTTTGAGPYVHTFASGLAARPSASIEIQHPDVPAYTMFSGLCAESMTFELATTGLLSAEVKLMGQKAGDDLSATAAGTPSDPGGVRFGHFNGSVARNGTPLAVVTTAKFTYANNLDPVRVIRSDGLIEALDPTVASLTGEVTVRFANTTLLNQARAGTSCSLEFGWTIDASRSLLLTAHEVYLSRPSREISGPKGVEMTFQMVAAKATSPARMFTAVLTNSAASY